MPPYGATRITVTTENLNLRPGASVGPITQKKPSLRIACCSNLRRRPSRLRARGAPGATSCLVVKGAYNSQSLARAAKCIKYFCLLPVIAPRRRRRQRSRICQPQRWRTAYQARCQRNGSIALRPLAGSRSRTSHGHSTVRSASAFPSSPRRRCQPRPASDGRLQL